MGLNNQGPEEILLDRTPFFLWRREGWMRKQAILHMEISYSITLRQWHCVRYTGSLGTTHNGKEAVGGGDL